MPWWSFNPQLGKLIVVLAAILYLFQTKNLTPLKYFGLLVSRNSRLDYHVMLVEEEGFPAKHQVYK